MAASKLEKTFNSDNQHNTLQNRQLCITKKLNHKLVTENAMLVEADKGKTIVIINSDEYSRKVHTSITHKSLLTRPTDQYPTNNTTKPVPS